MALVGRPLWANCGLMRCNRARIPSCFRATPNGQWKFFDPLLKQAFPPAQPDLFLADEIERLRLAPPDGGAANYRAGRPQELESSARLISQLFGGFLTIEFMFKRSDLGLNYFDYFYIRRH